MIQFNLRKYIDYVKTTRNASIEDQYLEKDYVLSYFLSNWQNLRDQGKLASLDTLIFKGGTLLMRNYLSYPRISEDLDFTHKQCTTINKMSQKNRIHTIRTLIIPILDDIKILCDQAGFDFKTKRDDTTYITSYHHKAVYTINIYYPSEIINMPMRIKIEINFVEHLQYPTVVQTIGSLVTNNPVLASMGYHLTPIRLSTYALEEIVLEKYRALLTRDACKQRDMYDLYCINKKGFDVFAMDEQKIRKKIDSGRLASSHSEDNLLKNCAQVITKGCMLYEDDVTLLTISPIDRSEYEQFKKQLFKRLLQICMGYKQ